MKDENKTKEQFMLKGKNYRIIVMAILLIACCLMIFYYHRLLDSGVVFTHFFYIPIILAALWWKRKGLMVAFFLAAILILSNFFLREDVFIREDFLIANDYIRSVMFIVISFVVAWLSEQISKSEEALKKHRDQLDGLVKERTYKLQQEITERKLAEESLRERENQYKHLYSMVRLMCDNLPDLIWTKDLEGKFIFVNKSCCEKLLNAKDTDEPIGKKDMYFANREKESHSEEPNYHTFGETCTGSDLAVLKSKKPQRFDEFGNVQGEFLYLDVYKAPFWDGKGDIIGTVGCARIVTKEKQLEKDRKRAEEALRKSEAQMRQIIDTVPHMIFAKDRDGRFIMANKTVADGCGTTPENVVGKQHPALLGATPDEYESFLADDREVIDSGKLKFIPEENFTYPDGHTVVLETTKIPFTSAGIPAILGIAVDITERKKAEEAVRASESQKKAILDGIPTNIAFVNKKLEILWVNKAAADYVGQSPAEMLGHTCYSFWADLEKPCDGCPTLKAFQTKKSEHTIMHTPNGRVWDERGEPVFDSAGKLIGVVAIAHNITERKKAEEKIDRYMKELERSNKELEQFAYVASHDLQEPLRMVSSYTQLIEERYKDKLDKDANEFINYAVDGANRMQILINDLLNYSRITTRGKPFEPVDFNSALGHAIVNMQMSIEETGTIILNDELPTVKADESQIIRVFQNLIDNAIKFRSEKSPKIYISAKQEKGEYVFSVKDNGISIKPEYKERIFQIFQRLHGRKEYSGTGIGLSICKRIVERHGGRMWLESESGKGSTFYFIIPKRGEIK